MDARSLPYTHSGDVLDANILLSKLVCPQQRVTVFREYKSALVSGLFGAHMLEGYGAALE